MGSRSRVECPKYQQVISKDGVKSDAWQFFGFPGDENGKILSEKSAICKLCSSPVSSKSTSNLWSHLRYHHPPQFKKYARSENQLQLNIPDPTENSTQLNIPAPTENSTQLNTSPPTENSSFMKQEARSEPDTATGTSEVESEVSMDNSTPPPSMHHLVVYNDGTSQVVPTKRLRTGRFTSTENFIQQSPAPKTTQQSSALKTVPEDLNELFLRSLLPDISKLNPSKLRHFKTFVLTKLTDLLDEQDAETEARQAADRAARPYVVDSCSVDY